MRSARQRLRVDLPANVSFDTEPLRINGKAVSLERGDAQASTFFVPLVGQSADAPFLLELRYTVSGTGLALDCPAFPEEPAIQKVYVSAWLPQEKCYLGSLGPWTDEMGWRLRDTGWRLGPNQDDGSLIRWVREGLPGAAAEQSFQTDGRPYLFSTLRPAAPPAGRLRLIAMDGDYFSILVCGAILAIGIALVFTRAAVRMLAVGAFVVLLVLLGVFAPTFAMQMASGVTFAAAGVVLVVWALWWLLVTRPRDPRVFFRRKAREAALAAAGAKPPAPPAGEPLPAGESPPAGPPAAEGKDEGGEKHA
jgi:drug/metabolite transporter superfamily protein YnfA